jgi:crossover junction endodeoxyribonuclease RuvC
MFVLGLDLSSVNTGYAVLDLQQPGGVDSATEDLISNYQSVVLGETNSPAQLIDYGSIIPNKKFSHSEKLKFIYDSISQILEKYPSITIVALEDQHFRNNANTLKLLARISGVAMLAAEQHGCEIALYPAATVKKGFTGNGKAEKEDMISAVLVKFGLELTDDNIADAIGVAYTYFLEQRKESSEDGNHNRKSKAKTKSRRSTTAN